MLVTIIAIFMILALLATLIGTLHAEIKWVESPFFDFSKGPWPSVIMAGSAILVGFYIVWGGI